MRGKLTWTPQPNQDSDDVALEAFAAPPPTWPGDPTLSQRDELVFLLQTTSEIEHALMIQYLYAAFSVESNAMSREILSVAKQEMGHLVTVQNILRSLRAPLTLEREDYPFRSQLYPFEFTLEPLSLHSLAKYILAEMPESPDIPDNELEEIQAAAQMDPDDAGKINRVGELFDKLIHQVTEHFSDADFSPSTVPLQAKPADWGASEATGVIVMTIATKDDVLEALREIAEQGEGNEAPDPGDPPSHFEVFLKLYRDLKAAGDGSVIPVPVHPNTAPVDFPDEEQDLAGGRITHDRARRWALLSNLRYRKLLTDIMHSLSLPSDQDGPEADLRNQAFNEMFRLSRISGVLTTLPKGDENDPARAAVPFEMPYSLEFPDNELGRWLLHRDLILSSQALSSQLADLVTDDLDSEKALLSDLDRDDQQRLDEIDARISELRPPGEGEVTTIKKLYLLPPVGIARFGSSPEAMDNYELGEPDSEGWPTLNGAETLLFDPVSGEITGVTTPDSVKFRDAELKIRPVCPFIEVWAQFEEDGEIQPLTLFHLRQMNLDASAIQWRVRAANHKASRRTGDADDRIEADTGDFSNHAAQPLTGHSPNFKTDKSISFGSVRYVQPNDEFPEIRMRFRPAHGLVFGPDPADENIADDVYDATKGNWDGHQDFDDASRPQPTVPGGIYAQDSQGRSLGYLDDACDGIVAVSLSLPDGAEPLTATARIASGPPHFSPDTLPVRTVADELEQMILGHELEEISQTDAQELGKRATDIINRALGTVRLMNTDMMNISGMASHDQRLRRAGEAIFEPRSRAAYATAEGRHAGIIDALSGIDSPAGSPERAAAVGALSVMAGILREYDKVGDLTDEGRAKMPAMMRNADGMHLALTRRQRETVRQAAEQLGGEPPTPGTPEDEMLALVANFSSFSSRHGHLDTSDNTPLSQLFADPPALLDFLKSGNVQGGSAPADIEGDPLVVPGDPDASAFVKILETQGHPMNSRFSSPIAALGGKTGVEIVRAWIASLDS